MCLFLKGLEKEFAGQLESLELKVYELAGREFNLNSPKQLGQVLFEDLGISTRGVKRTKTGYSTNAAMLNKLSSEHEIVPEILEYRELFKLQSTYVTALSRIAKPDTNRVHSSFNQAVAATGRLSSSDPNLQNIPIRNPRGKQIRKAFIAGDGKVLLKADYSQIELRVLAHLADDAALQRAFKEGEDIHFKTAVELFGAIATSGSDATRLRRIAKTINFGVIYGMSAFRLANELGISRSEASRYIDDYFARYPNVSKYYDWLNERVESDGYVETMFGRRRYLKDIDTSGRDAGYASRSLMNAPIQGSAAEIIKLAMCKVDEFLSDKEEQARMLLQVHDELVFEVDETVLDSIRDGVVKEMETAVKLAVPLKVDVSVGRSWGDGE
jgi:DNA polymerase-1